MSVLGTILKAGVFGFIAPEVVCPHCQVKGKVHTRRVDRKAGVSGGKATAAVLTGGLSLFATGLSRHSQVTQAYCENCRQRWEF